MARNAETKQLPADAPEVSATRALALTQMQGEMRVIDEANEARVTALATKLGYEGALTVGGLEDEIRFYQRQTVDNWVQVGKRLLLLKEATPHGEFDKRRELLGFSSAACSRFISSAQKIRKSSKLEDLAGRAKNMSAWMELITLDDDVIEQLGEMDEFDKMSPTQLRAAARELGKELTAAEQVTAKYHAKADKAEARLKVIQAQKPAERWLTLQKEATALMNDALGCIHGQLRAALKAIEDHAKELPDENCELFMAGLVGQVQMYVTELRNQFNLPDLSTAADLQAAAEIAQWAPKKGAV